MLAALLLNLGTAPTPPPAVTFFPPRGGGPFLKKYGYDPRYYRQDEEEEELSKPQEEIVEAALERAVDAIRLEEKPAPIVLDAKRIYERVYRDLHRDGDWIREMWRAEIKRRIQQQEDEEICLMLLS